MSKIADLLRMIKFSHTIFAFPFAIVSFLINKSEFPTIDKILYIILALIFARSSAMSFNRLVDCKYDRENPRTKNRELITGKLKKGEVIFFLTVTSLGFIGFSSLINNLCFVLSPFVLVLLYFYSYWKRFSIFSHLYLGLAIGLAPIGVDIALNETISISSILLFLSVALWICGFDIIYSLLDIEFDRKTNLFSLPSRFGTQYALTISRIAYTLMILSLLSLGWLNQFGLIYYLGVGGITVLLVTQHFWVKPHDFSRVNLAFFNLNSLISLFYLGIVLLELYFSVS